MLMLRAHGARLSALQERCELDLVDVRLHLRFAEQLFEVRHEVVADADRLGFAVGERRLERAPRVATLALHRPVHEVEVDVIEPEPREARIERAQRRVVALIVVPQLRRHEHVGARALHWP